MRIADLIEKLSNIREAHGNIDVVVDFEIGSDSDFRVEVRKSRMRIDEKRQTVYYVSLEEQ